MGPLLSARSPWRQVPQGIKQLTHSLLPLPSVLPYEQQIWQQKSSLLSGYIVEVSTTINFHAAKLSYKSITRSSYELTCKSIRCH
jgi:hypothetical protein